MSLRDELKGWSLTKTDTAKQYFLSRTIEDIIGVTMLVSLLVCAWILLFVGFNPYRVDRAVLGHLYVTFPLLLVLPSSLALTLRTPVGYLLTTPYLAVIGINVIENVLLYLAGPGANVGGRMFVSFVVVYGLPFALFHMWCSVDDQYWAKAYRLGCAFQFLLLTGATYFFTFHYGVRHLAQPIVNVQRVRFLASPLSFPLVEEDAAFLVDRRGRLFRIELATGRKQLIALIPRPTPAEVGLPRLKLAPIDASSSAFLGVLTRKDGDKLLFRYEYSLVQPIDSGGWRHAESVTLEVKVNEQTGAVKWQAQGGFDRTPVDMPRSSLSTIAQGTAISVSGPVRHTALIQGKNIRTMIDTLGWVNWMHAEHGWILIGTSRGSIIIATIKEN